MALQRLDFVTYLLVCRPTGCKLTYTAYLLVVTYKKKKKKKGILSEKVSGI